MDVAYAFEQIGNRSQANAIRERFRENMARELTGEILWHARSQHELELLLDASTGEIEQALAAFEALFEDGWRWLVGPGQNIVRGYRLSANGF
ncbi:MAG: hypothetical protein QGG67_05760 [Gammaproteobacteria bacterium]|nr:hypothetical protein [Gammaproteobacteria bacterium]MDP6095481.1 hypothetical protein [Gammaproteobacteria bacterium]MDP7455125.1 hypothetical protein [Gammaproteobacteria bacterium]HJO12634.1 hypothetical protein [Gammaproteobacteria bacterium]